MQTQPEKQGTIHADVLVVGGGLAGLTAATFLARAGCSVCLCERGQAPGGRAVTRVDQGFHLNMGPHALYRQGAGVQVLRELGVDYSGSSPLGSEAWLTVGDRFRPLPGTAWSLLGSRLFSLGERARLLRFFGGLQKLDTRGIAELTLNQWLVREGYDGNAGQFIRTLVRLSSYCHAADRISAGAALAQLRVGLGGVLYLDGGWQTLVNSLMDQAEQQGVAIQRRAGVERLAGRAGAMRAELSDGCTVHSRFAVLAVAPDVARDILGPDAAPELKAFAASAEPVRAACLDLGLSELPDSSVTFALDLEQPFYCSRHSAHADLAPAGRHLFQLARYGDDEGDARSRLESWMDILQPGWRDSVMVARYLRSAPVMHALPAAAMGGTSGRPGTRASGNSGVFLCGDWVGKRGLLSDAAFSSAREAAQAILGQWQKVAA